MTRARGFTLLELLVAIALLVVLSGAIFGFVRDLNTQRGAIGDRGRTTLRGSALFDQLERSLMTCVAERDGEAGVSGATDSITVLARAGGGVGGELGSGTSLTISHDSRTAEVLAERDGEPERVLVDEVRRLRLRYLVSGRWSSSFDAVRQGGLPEAVEVSVWFGGVDEDELLDGVQEGLGDSVFGDGMGELGPEFDLLRDGMEGMDGFDQMDELGPPDRRRVIAVPDGSDAGWARFTAGGIG